MQTWVLLKMDINAEWLLIGIVYHSRSLFRWSWIGFGISRNPEYSTSHVLVVGDKCLNIIMLYSCMYTSTLTWTNNNGNVNQVILHVSIGCGIYIIVRCHRIWLLHFCHRDIRKQLLLVAQLLKSRYKTRTFISKISSLGIILSWHVSFVCF